MTHYTRTMVSRLNICYLYHEAKAENYLLIWNFSITWNVNLKWQETYNRIMGEVGKVTCSISSWFVSKLHFYLYHNVSEFSSTFSLLFYMFHVKFVFQHSYLVRSNLTLQKQRTLRMMYWYSERILNLGYKCIMKNRSMPSYGIQPYLILAIYCLYFYTITTNYDTKPQCKLP